MIERSIDMTDETILTILKTDVPISASATGYDQLLNGCIKLAKKDIKTEGITLQDTDEDGMLVEQYAAWIFRKRKENAPMPRQLRYMLNNRLLSQKMEIEEEEN